MIALRHRNDPTPSLAPLAGLVVRRVSCASAMAVVQQRAEVDLQRRFDAGHRAHVAYLNDAPAAFGWVATRSAEIGELRSTFALASGERYLWNFVTLAQFRGLGVYPRLVAGWAQRAQTAEAQREGATADRGIPPDALRALSYFTTVTVRVTLLDWPAASRTVSVTVYVPERR